MRVFVKPLACLVPSGLFSDIFGMALALMVFTLTRPTVLAQPADPGAGDDFSDPMTALTQQQWDKVDAAIDRALAWIAKQQRADGSFPTFDTGQPAVTSLATMAFLARGHLPGEGPYGAVIDDAIEFVLTCQQPTGLLAKVPTSQHQPDWGMDPRRTAPYNHPISSVFLCEVYGMTSRDKSMRIRRAIERALDFSLAQQRKPKRFPQDEGGWRYVDYVTQDNTDADLSISSWQLMFLRSARNAGFDIPSDRIDAAVGYVQRCFKPRFGSFTYGVQHPQLPSRAMAGAGIVALSLSGLHETDMARSAANWILAQSFDKYRGGTSHQDQFHYGVYHCSLAMFQMGGHFWERFYPRVVRVLVGNQSSQGHWQPELTLEAYDNVYTTALVVNALCVPYQLIPIYQR